MIRMFEKKESSGKKESRDARSSCRSAVPSNSGRLIQLQRTIENEALRDVLLSGTVRRKLKVGAPDDIYEREADRMADKAMRVPDSAIQKKPT